MGEPVHIEVPKSRRSSPPAHVTNCRQMGLSSPRRARSLSRVSFEAKELSPAKRSSTMSPGTMRIRKKTSTATPSNVGIMRRTRVAMYRGKLLAQPHRIELLVEVVTRGDHPAPDLRAVRDDPVPLERVDVVHLFVQEPPLELADEPLALLGVRDPALLLVQLVEGLVGVATVVGRALVLRLELVEIEVGLDDVAALKIRGDLEVAGPQDLAVVRGRLDHLLLHGEADLAPLVDQPDAERLVGHGHAPV